MNWKKDTLFGRVESGDFANLKSDLEQVVAKKVSKLIRKKKSEIVNGFNGISEEYEGDDIELDDVMSKVSNGDALTDMEKNVLGAAIDAAKGDEKNDVARSEALDQVMSKVAREQSLTDEDIEVLEAALAASETVVFDTVKKLKKKK